MRGLTLAGSHWMGRIWPWCTGSGWWQGHSPSSGPSSPQAPPCEASCPAQWRNALPLKKWKQVIKCSDLKIPGLITGHITHLGNSLSVTFSFIQENPEHLLWPQPGSGRSWIKTNSPMHLEGESQIWWFFL